MFALIRNLAAATASFIGASVWTKGISYLVRENHIQPRVARKLMHITTAPLFALTWPLYASTPYAALFAASVPLSFAFRIFRNPENDPIVRAVARAKHISSSTTKTDESATSIPSAEYLRHAYGPGIYALSVAFVTATSWRRGPETYVALAALCFGDGMADVVGTAVDGMRLPLPKSVFTKKKTLPGTLAMFVSSVVGSVGLLAAARLALPFATVVAASAGAAVAELLPVDDNMPVPLAAYFIVKALKL